VTPGDIDLKNAELILMSQADRGSPFLEALDAVAREYWDPARQRRPHEPYSAWLARLYDTERFVVTADLLAEHCPRGGTVLDIGAWPGYFTTCLKRMGWAVVAVDKSARRAVRWTQDELLSKNSIGSEPQASVSLANLCEREGIPIVNVDIEDEPLPFEADSVDTVLLTEVIEHTWRDPLFVLTEINRVLKSGSGKLILSTPNLLSIRNRLAFFGGRIENVIEHPFVSYLKARRLGHLGHLRLYAPSELVGMLELLGFACAVRYERVSPQAETPMPSGGNGAASAAANPSSGALKRLRRFFKTPRQFADAMTATFVEFAEERVPRFRGRMFIVATKVSGAEFEQNHPKELEQIVRTNSLGSHARR
jgi:SAM-dependent methyltransferase